MNTQERIISRFLDYVKIDSETGDEAAIAQRLAVDLERLGCCVTTDCIQETAKTSGSNVYAVRQGDPKLAPILFSAHMDTVAPGKGIQPVAGAYGYLYSNGTTVLGGDDKAGICAIMEALERTAGEGRAGHAVVLLADDGVLGHILKPCVDEKDTSKKRRNKIIQCERKDRFAMSKARKSWIFQNGLSFQKFYVPEMQEQVFNGRSKIALTQIASRAADRCIIASERRGGII